MLSLSLMKATNSFKTFLIATNVNDLTLAAVAGNPSVKGNFRFIVLAGVVVGQSQSNNTGAMMLGTFPAGSNIEIVNNGYIYGKGGLGGTYSSTVGPQAGGKGGDALRLDYSQSIRVINNGEIRGGGGGGACGGQGGSGANGGRGNITATTDWQTPRSDYEWYMFDDSSTHNGVSWPGIGYSDENGEGETLMLAPAGLFERGAYWGHTQDAHPHRSWYVRYHSLQPGGLGGVTRAGGAGGNGAGYSQTRTDGSAGQGVLAGAVGTNGAGSGGNSGRGGDGGNGGDWAQPGGFGTDGTGGSAGTGGVAGGYSGGEGPTSPVGGGGPSTFGVAGRAIVKGVSTVTYVDNGVTSGAVVTGT